MIRTLAIAGYRSLYDIALPLRPLTVVTGENGSGKSNLYKALKLLADCAEGRIIASLAHEGGLPQVLWAGPETVSASMKRGETAVQGGPRRKPVRLKLGFSGDDYGYRVELGMPVPGDTAFTLDPEIKREALWHGEAYRAASALIDRKGSVVRRREGRRWTVVEQNLPLHDSFFVCAGDPVQVPEVHAMQRDMRRWRFYAEFRTDADAPARKLRPATRAPVLAHDGADLAAAIQTILEIGNAAALHETIDDAFPEARLVIDSPQRGYLSIALSQRGLLRELDVAEWSDGTLRFVLLVAALLSPQPPSLLVLNEPENSLHPDLLPALARLIRRASDVGQVWVISHASRLVRALCDEGDVVHHVLERPWGQTQIHGMRDLDKPVWRWD